MEVISGKGYDEIVIRDYENINDDAQKALLILAGISSTTRMPASETTLSRALKHLKLSSSVYYLSTQMQGIVAFNRGNITTRHRVYAEKLFENHIQKKEMFEMISAYIQSFTVYEHPVSRRLSKPEFEIYKHLTNSRALNKLLGSDEALILSIYEKFEKDFENEGQFLQQYGLALRSFHKHKDSYEKFKLAHHAYPESGYIEHGLAQQMLILAEQSDSESVAMNLLNEAEATLKRLHTSKFHAYDRYPIISLSRGHVQVLDKYNKEKAKEKAKDYFNIIEKNHELKGDYRVEETAKSLMKYYLLGTPLPRNEFYS